MSWTLAETNTHQDHVIAHVIGATPLGHFVWDETAYIAAGHRIHLEHLSQHGNGPLAASVLRSRSWKLTIE